MASKQEAQAMARKLHALVGGAEIVRKAAARELARRHPVDSNEIVQHLIELTREGWEPARCALGAIVAALSLEAQSIPDIESLQRLASVQSLEHVSALFVEAPPQKEMNAGAAAKADALAFSQSLGHLKQKARVTRNPDELAKLAQVSNPAVIRNALMNPRLTEELVVRMAAKRPARPEPLAEIWSSPRWSVRLAVRRALIFNPYLPVEIGSKIVPLLGRRDWREIARDGGLHPSLREQARRLIEPADGASSH